MAVDKAVDILIFVIIIVYKTANIGNDARTSDKQCKDQYYTKKHGNYLLIMFPVFIISYSVKVKGALMSIVFCCFL